MPRWARIVLGAIVVVLLLIVAGIFLLTRTDFGHERVRRLALSQLRGATHGRVEIGGLRGNLLRGLTLLDLSIADSAGNPLLRAAEVTATYSLRSLISKHIYLSDVRLVDPLLVLDRPPGGVWNFRRIFPTDTTAPPDTTLGFGSWIRLTDVTVVSGHVIVRNPWSPPDSLAPAARDSAIRAAIGPGGRFDIRRVPGGYQMVMEFREIGGRLPLLRIADPDSSNIVARIDSLAMQAQVLRPPAADLRELAGAFVVTPDSLRFMNVHAALPGSKLTAEGAYALESGDLYATVRADPVAFADVQWLYHDLPDRGGGSVALTLARRGERTEIYVDDAVMRIDSAMLEGAGGLALGDTLRVFDTDLRLHGVTTRLIEELAEGVDIPRSGTIEGRVSMEGTPHALHVDGTMAFDAAAGGVSRVRANGTVGFDRGFTADRLRLRFEPVQLALARAFAPSLPLAGRLTGTATVTGSLAGRMHAQADLVHSGTTGQSHLVGGGDIVRDRRYLDVTFRADPVSLATVGRFAPGAGLHGTATGDLGATGTLDDLAIHANLAFPRAGNLSATGRVAVAGRPKRYDVQLVAELFDAAGITTHAPHTSLTGYASATGSGLDPATLDARITASLQSSEVDSIGVDTIALRASLADGTLHLDTLVARTQWGGARAGGTFGLVEGRTGELTYDVAIDSLAGLRRWLPADTGATVPRPAIMAQRITRARADSLRIATATEVQRAATGFPPRPRLEVDTVGAIPRDSIAGSIHATGTLNGGIGRFDARGRATFADVILRGSSVRRGRAEYEWLSAPTPRFTARLDAAFDSVLAGGFALDSVTIVADYGRESSSRRGRDSASERRRPEAARPEPRTPVGTAEIAVHQDSAREYRVAADYEIREQERRVRLTDMLMRFDSTLWVSTGPSAIVWGGSGFAIRNFELTHGGDSRIFMNGRLPSQGSGELEVDIAGLQTADIASLLQSTVPLRGTLDLHANITGSQVDPRVEGTVALDSGTYGTTALPDAHASFEYAGLELDANARLEEGGDTLLAADAHLPVNLAIKGVTGPRLLDGPLRIDARADSVPLDSFGELTTAVDDVHGAAGGELTVRGTAADPEVRGRLQLNVTQAYLTSLGVHVRQVAGAIDLRHDTIVIDSLAGYADGSIRVTGGIGLRDIRQPSFDLHVQARDALILNTDRGRLHTNADIAVAGPYDATHVTGSVDILRGVLYIPESSNAQRIDPTDPALAAAIDTTMVRPDVLHAGNPLLDNLSADLDITIARDTWVRSTEANVEIYTPPDMRALTLHMDRGEQRLSLEGFVNTDRGEYAFMGRRFDLRTGSVIFVGSPSINPLLQINAAHEVQLPSRGALTIRIGIGGTMRKPSISLSSDAQPPIPETDLLSYLAFGSSSTSLLQQQGSGLSSSGSSGGGLAGNVAALATRQLTGIALNTLVQQFQEDATRSLGLDVFRITPADLPDELSFGGVGTILRGTQIDAGKYLTPRFFAAVQVRPTAAAPGFRLEYRLPSGFSWTASLEPRFLTRPPTLATDQSPITTSVFGAFFMKAWRY